MNISDPTLVLDRKHLSEITLDDPDIMRQVLAALIDDTSRQIHLLNSAIQDHDAARCARLAHYSKGACANVGANKAAVLLEKIEHNAAAGAVAACESELAVLSRELEQLRAENI